MSSLRALILLCVAAGGHLFPLVFGSTYSLGFCLDVFPALKGSEPTGSKEYVIDVKRARVSNWLHIFVRRPDSNGRIEGVALQAVDQDGLPLGRFGTFSCKDDAKWNKAARMLQFEDCDLPNENMLDEPNMAYSSYQLEKPPPAEIHASWRFARADEANITSIQFIGLVIESFEKQKYFSNVRSPVVELHPVPLTKAYFAKDNADLQGNCHEKGMGDQWSLTTGDVINFNSDYIAKIKRFST